MWRAGTASRVPAPSQESYALSAMFFSMTASVSWSSLVGLNSITSVPAYKYDLNSGLTEMQRLA